MHLEGEPSSVDGTTTLTIKANTEEAALIRFANFLMFGIPNQAQRVRSTSQNREGIVMNFVADTLTITGPDAFIYQGLQQAIEHPLPPPPSESSRLAARDPLPIPTTSAPAPSTPVVTTAVPPLADLPAVTLVASQITTPGQGLGLVRGRLNQILRSLNVEIVKLVKPRADMVTLLQSLTTDQDFASLVQPGHSDEDMIRVYNAFLRLDPTQIKAPAEIRDILQQEKVTLQPITPSATAV